jgi:heat shock protein HslJ
VRRAAALLLGAVLAGCATGRPVPDPTIDARGYWTVVAVNGQATGGGDNFHFVITPPVGSAQFGCNAGGGSMTAGNGWVVSGDWIITVAGCRTKRIGELERMGFEVTARPMAIERGADGIRLRNEHGTIELARRAFPSLIGRWRIITVNGRAVTGTADIAAGRSIISFGCNHLRGAYRQEGERLLAIMPMGTTERGCMTPDGAPSEAMQREDEGFRIATRNMQVTFHGPDRVRLSNEAGTIDLAR